VKVRKIEDVKDMMLLLARPGKAALEDLKLDLD
jgi:hypothetical protein